MAKKARMTQTSRHFFEQRPLAQCNIPAPHFHVPIGRTAVPRLSGHGPGIKHSITAEHLANQLGLLESDAIIFLDTNMFTTPLHEKIWEAISARSLYVTPMIWKELLPWLKKPHHNPRVRNSIRSALIQLSGQRFDETFGIAPLNGAAINRIRSLSTFFTLAEYDRHAADYYFKVLSMRKIMGKRILRVMQEKLGRPPTNTEFMAEVQAEFGERGLMMAKKGIEALANSEHPFADEELAVRAFLTAILTGSEVVVLTRDLDVFEQCLKFTTLIRENYRAFLAAERYFLDPSSMQFLEKEVPTSYASSVFTASPVLEFRCMSSQFNVLPPSAHVVNVYCWLLGGERSNLKVTQMQFLAEAEMSESLRIKAATGSLNTNRLWGKNCSISTKRSKSDDSEVLVTIGTERTFKVDQWNVVCSDFMNTL